MLLQKRCRYQKHRACTITLPGTVPDWGLMAFPQFVKNKSAEVFVLLLPSLTGSKSLVHPYQADLW